MTNHYRDGREQFAGDHEEHYSYQVYRRPEVAGSFDKARFGGEIGAYFHEHQLRIIRENIPIKPGTRILDLGAGTGRTAIPLRRLGAEVTAADYSWPMLQVARQKSTLQGDKIGFLRVDAHHLPFPDNHFDAVLSFRMLMHVKNWKTTLAEICRVASKRIVVDFPPLCGFAGLAPVVHPFIRHFNKNHQPYRIFTLRSVRRELEENNFEVAFLDRHLVLPFGLHRFIGSVTATRKIEGLLAGIGLKDFFGAPVTIVAERNPDS